jgi:GTPase Era involved in 16S rRNA processing
VANKWDALNMSGKAQATKRFTAAFPEHEVVPHSTLSGEGRDRLLGKIGEALAR